MPRAWLTPDSPAPEETRCRTISVPDDLTFVGAVTGALLPLTNPASWEQSGNMTPEEAAEIMSVAFEAFVASECSSECPPPVLPDVETPIYRQNPTTGRWEYIGPDGWVEPTGDDAIPEPGAREEETEALQKCGAASNAANSLKELYAAILGVYDSEIDPLLNQIEIAAQIAVAYGTTFGPVSQSFLAYCGAAWETFTYLLDQITADDWDTEWMEELVCILNSNVEVTDGVAHFDFFNVNNDLVGFILPVIDDFVRVRWQTWFLLQCIGTQGLDLAGATTAVEADCVTCDSWCYTGTPDGIGAVLTQGYFNNDGHAVAASIDGAWRLSVSLSVDTTNCVVKRFGYNFQIPGGYGNAYHYYQIISSSPSSAVETSGITADYWTPDNAAIVSTTNPAVCSMYVGHTSAQHKITAITVYGTGINPFGVGSNC